MIVRWGLEELPGVLDEIGVERLFLVAGPRWDALTIPATARWSEVPSDRIVVPAGVDGILAVGGGSAITGGGSGSVLAIVGAAGACVARTVETGAGSFLENMTTPMMTRTTAGIIV